MKNRLLMLGLVMVASASYAAEIPVQRWSEARAVAWKQKTGWLVGCDFLPSTAVNQLEMFQADSFDLPTVDRELGWAQSLGFNAVRVYLQDQLWEQEGFVERLDQFLATADRHGIGAILVLFD